MAHSVIDILPRIKSMARRYSLISCVPAEDLESVGALAVLTGQKAFDESRGTWEPFATRLAQNGMRDEIRKQLNQTQAQVLYDALSTTATMTLLAAHGTGATAIEPSQYGDALRDQVIRKLDTNALGRALFEASAMSGKLSCEAIALHGNRRRKASPQWHRKALKNARDSAKSLLD